MTFYYAEHAWVFAGVVLLPLVFVINRGIRNKRRQLFTNPTIQKRLLADFNPNWIFWRRAVLFLSCMFLAIAILRPLYGLVYDKTERKTQQILVGLDVSLSMLARDIKPSRFLHAKQEIQRLIHLLKGDSMGLLLFSGASVVQCPLTMDTGAMKLFLDDSKVGSIRYPGTNISAVIREALERFQIRKNNSLFLIIVSDGEVFDEAAIKMAKKAAKKGMIIYTIGVGTETGEPIPLIDKSGKINGYKKDKSDSIVLSKINPHMLRSVAEATGGSFYMTSESDLVMDRIYEEISRKDRQMVKKRATSRYQERYQIPLSFALLCWFFYLLIPTQRKTESEWRGRA